MKTTLLVILAIIVIGIFGKKESHVYRFDPIYVPGKGHTPAVNFTPNGAGGAGTGGAGGVNSNGYVEIKHIFYEQTER
jgi:hypothetical protein